MKKFLLLFFLVSSAYSQTMTLTSISPSIGPVSGGIPVTLTGTNLGSTINVFFNTTGSIITSVSSTQIIVTLPAMGSGGLATVYASTGIVHSNSLFFNYAVATSTQTQTATQTSTNTPSVTNTSTNTPTVTSTNTKTNTQTSTSTSTSTPTQTPYFTPIFITNLTPVVVTPPPNVVAALVYGVGGGGGSGGVTCSNITANGSQAGSGATYGWNIFPITSIGSSINVTIGAGGTAGSAGQNPGGNGGLTSFGSLMNLPGGPGGAVGTAGSGNNTCVGPNTASAPATGTLWYSQGEPGTGYIVVVASSTTTSSKGGSSLMGLGGTSTYTNNSLIAGTSGTGYGSGAGGAQGNSSSGSAAGAAGMQGGLVIQWLFSKN